jgi:SAM-dependent methyltransferase
MKLNLGCGENHKIGWVNVDNWGRVDCKWDLNVTPYPWESNSVDEIEMNHVLEHLPNWWEAFRECARVLKPGGVLRINVPDESSTTALAYRDHVRIFTPATFHGIYGPTAKTNAWAATELNSVPVTLIQYNRVPHKRFNWMVRFPWLLEFCADHLRNFIHEQRFVFQKIAIGSEKHEGN